MNGVYCTSCAIAGARENVWYERCSTTDPEKTIF